MNQRTHPHHYLDREEKDERRTLFWNFTASSVFHLIVFAVLIFAPGYAKGRKPSLSVINVSIVTLPSQGEMPLPEKKNAVESEKPSVTEKKAPKISTKTTPKAVSKPSTSISLNPKKKVKTSLKKKTFKTEKVVKSAIDRIEKKIDNRDPIRSDRRLPAFRSRWKRPDRKTLKINRISGVRESRGEPEPTVRKFWKSSISIESKLHIGFRKTGHFPINWQGAAPILKPGLRLR